MSFIKGTNRIDEPTGKLAFDFKEVTTLFWAMVCVITKHNKKR